MSDNAYKLGRTMVWSNTARSYIGSFEMAQRQRTAPRESVAARDFIAPFDGVRRRGTAIPRSSSLIRRSVHLRCSAFETAVMPNQGVRRAIVLGAGLISVHELRDYALG